MAKSKVKVKIIIIMQKIFKTKPKGSTLRRNLQSKFQGGGKGDVTPKILRFSGNPEGGKPKAFEKSIFRKMRTLAVSLACKACPRLRGVPAN